MAIGGKSNQLSEVFCDQQFSLGNSEKEFNSPSSVHGSFKLREGGTGYEKLATARFFYLENTNCVLKYFH